MPHRLTGSLQTGLGISASAIALLSCGHRDVQANSDTATRTYPPGILTTVEARTSIRGVYPEPADLAQTCCWIGDDAYFIVVVSPRANNLVLTIYEPAIKAVTESQSVSLIDAAGRVASSHSVAAGAQMIRLRLPKNVVQSGVASIHLRAGRSFVPRAIGMNGDTRHLALILRAVETN
jgi:hypothetical protein